jgi:hypothetical protein
MKDKIGTLVITKELFVKVINALKEQSDHDDKCVDAFNVILPDDRVMGYSNTKLVIMLQDLLELSFKDNTEHSWIEYFIYELDYGRKYTEGCATEADGTNIDLSTPEKLYKFLLKD